MSQLELVVDGLSFPEGPAFDRTGTLYWTDMQGGRIGVLDPDSRKAETFIETGGKPNGCNFAPDGTLFIADAGLRQVLRVSPQGHARVFADGCDGVPFTGPNDLVFDSCGNFYLTDPVGSDLENPTGRVYYCRMDGSVTEVAAGLAFPNGLTLTPDGRTLLLAETMTREILSCEVLADGSLGTPRLWGHLADDGVGGDGMALAADGSLYVAHYGRGVIAVFSADGTLTDELPAGGARPTNVAFGGPNFDELYITETETDAIYCLKLGVSGEPLFPDRRP